MDKGTHFYNCDFQVHTPRDRAWSGAKPTSLEGRNEYASKFVLSCRDKGINAVAITDHHDFTFFPYIKVAAEAELDDQGHPIDPRKRLIVFPGLELTLSTPPCQVILIMDAGFPEDQLIRILHKLALEPSPPEDASTVETMPIPTTVINGLSDLKDKLDSIDILLGKYIILPHISKGHKGLLRRDFYEHYTNMPCVSGYKDGQIDLTDTGYMNIISGADRNYGFRSVAVFQTSDNRSETFDKLGTSTTWIKWAVPTAEALRQASLAKESRLTNNEPEVPQIQITKVSVTNSKFLGRVDLELNKQYNALIGGRGTGKSTILEYIRWGLCDQIIGGSDEEKSTIQLRRKRLIEKTLLPFGGEVRINVTVNGIEHTVKRNSESKEVLLKIGNGEFESVSEEEIRRILPIQAYSQKQLSDVGVRTDELKRFIQQPIAIELSDIGFKLKDAAQNIKGSYNDLIRKVEIDSEIEKLRLQEKSTKEQADGLRNSIKGIDEGDKKVIEAKQLYENQQTYIQESEHEISLFKEKLKSLVESVKQYPSGINTTDKLNNSELLGKIQAEKQARFRQLEKELEDVSKVLEGENIQELDRLVSEWKALKGAFDSDYIKIKEKATSNEGIINEITKLETTLREISNAIAERVAAIKEFSEPLEQFDATRGKWYQLHREKIELIDVQAKKFTELSQGLIQADVTKSINLDKIRNQLTSNFTGTRISKDKIENVCVLVSDGENPLDSWKVILEELRSLSELRLEENQSIDLPDTPQLTKAELNEGNRRRLAELLQPDAWLQMVTQEVEFEPTFKYATGNEMEDVIPFVEASAGQQATALLSVLLNQEGIPLLIDQPEDDIDNRAINDIIKNIWTAKQKRQLIFTSHNANLVVNGDAELVICCDYKESSQQTQGEIKLEGAIDNDEIRKEITIVMEGGEKAFKLRKDKYGF